MTYTRKTRDCWRFYLNYGQGWEHEITEYTRAEMQENRKAYRENCNYPLRIVKGRERIEEITPVPSVTACCIRDYCGMPFDASIETLNAYYRQASPDTLKPFWRKYCPKHRTDGKKHEPIIEVRP